MKIHAYILCYNEEELIEFTLRHYSKFCSKIFLVDNMSDDRSIEIARSFDKVTILRWNSNGTINNEYLCYLKANVYKWYSRKEGDRTTEVADWIIACDMDELLYHPSLERLLERAEQVKDTVFRSIGFNMSAPALPNPGQDITSSIRHRTRSTFYDKQALFHCDFDIRYTPGCHHDPQVEEVLAKQADYKLSDQGVLLLHYNNIGDRLLRTAQRNKNRLTREDVAADISTHYLMPEQEIIQNSQMLAKHAREVIDKNGRVLVDLKH